MKFALNTTKPAHSNRASLRLEALEDRVVTNSTFGHEPLNWAPDIDMNAGVVRIEGTVFADHVTVNNVGNQTIVSVTAAGQTTTEAYQGVQKVIFNGYHNNDKFFNNTGITSTAYGGSSHDLLQGGSNIDYLHGGTGDDYLIGKDGHDRLYGNAGYDVATGGEGSDRIYGGKGFDRLEGNQGDDFLVGGYGPEKDKMSGGAGRDHVFQYLLF